MGGLFLLSSWSSVDARSAARVCTLQQFGQRCEEATMAGHLASLSVRPIWETLGPVPVRKPVAPVVALRARVERDRVDRVETRKLRKPRALTRIGQVVEISQGAALLAWPFFIHMLFQLTDKLNALDGLFGRNVTLRVLVFVGSSMWLMKTALATNFRLTSRALNKVLSHAFEAAGLQPWLAEKTAEFLISFITRVSRVTVALAALMPGKSQHAVTPQVWG